MHPKPETFPTISSSATSCALSASISSATRFSFDVSIIFRRLQIFSDFGKILMRAGTRCPCAPVTPTVFSKKKTSTSENRNFRVEILGKSAPQISTRKTVSCARDFSAGNDYAASALKTLLCAQPLGIRNGSRMPSRQPAALICVFMPNGKQHVLRPVELHFGAINVE